jgi:polyisoprenoid-binding protein YceI
MTTTTTDTTAALPLAPGRWTLDATHSTVTFWIRHLGVSKVRGRFDRFDATLDVGATLDDVRVTATIDAASVDTGNADRDAHLRTADFLDAAQHPQLTFESTTITGAGEEWTMAGMLTSRGGTHPVSLAVEFGGVGDYFGTAHAGFAATGRIDRRQHDLQWTLPPGAPEAVLGREIHIQLDLQFVAPDPAQPTD